MLCNLDRIVSLMEEHNLDAIVASSFENVYYFSDTGSRLPFYTGTGAAAIITRKRNNEDTLCIAIPYISLITEKPTWMGNVEVFGSLNILVDKSKPLSWPESEVSNKLDSYKGKAHDSLISAVNSSLKRMHLSNSRVGFESLEFSKRVDSGLFGEAVNAVDLINEARVIKTTDEIALLRKSCEINEAAFLASLKHLNVGKNWQDVTLAWYTKWASEGGVGLFWGGGSGTHASQFYPAESSYELKDGDVIRYEGGGTYREYWADSGRSAIIGTPSTKQLEYINALSAGATAAKALIKPGSMPDDICNATLEAIRANGIKDFEISNVWGHGIGLSLNELPRIRPGIKKPLEAGMVICFETPYFEIGWGGLQLEDTYLITETGFEKFTHMNDEVYSYGA
jgi:Xaa-Pro dipeptidase